MKSRAQMEMIGLVVIVILITLGMLIFAAISAGQGPQEKKIFTRKELAYSTISALMKTTIEEGVCGVDFRPELERDILEDCAAHFPEDNFPFSNYECEIDGEFLHSCEFFEQTARDLFSETLDQWNKRYQFESQLIPYQAASDEDIEMIIQIVSERGGCPPFRERDTSTFFPLTIEATGAQVQSVLYICD